MLLERHHNYVSIQHNTANIYNKLKSRCKGKKQPRLLMVVGEACAEAQERCRKKIENSQAGDLPTLFVLYKVL